MRIDSLTRPLINRPPWILSLDGHGGLADQDAHKATLIYGMRDMEEMALQEFDAVSAPLFWTERPQFEEQQSIEVCA